MTKQLGWFFDAQACIGCKACEIACKDAHDLPLGIRWRHVWDYGGGSWTREDGFLVPKNMFTYHVSAACMHCLEPSCIAVCPAGAITKREDGIVLIDPAMCTGDRACEEACPYGAPQFDYSRKIMTKCTFCANLLVLGEKPACVAICPQRCLDFGELADLRAKYGDLTGIEPFPDPSITEPSIVIVPHSHAQKSGTGTGRVLTRIESLAE